jgi:glycine cleavage system H protein
MPDYPADLHYHPAHDWARIDGETAEFGITWHAQDALGDIVFFEAPEVGQAVEAGAPYGTLESVKAVSDIVAPMSGEVVAVNEDVVATPEQINGAPHEAWLVRVRLSDPGQVGDLLSAADYAAGLD